MGFFGFGKKNKEKEQEKMKTGLEKTRTGFWGNILNTLTGSVIDDDMYDDLEEQLILADVGGEVAVRLVDKLRDRVHEKGLKTGEEAADALRDIIAEEMTPEAEMALDGKPASHSDHRRQRCRQDHQYCKAGRLLHPAGQTGHAGRR